MTKFKSKYLVSSVDPQKGPNFTASLTQRPKPSSYLTFMFIVPEYGDFKKKIILALMLYIAGPQKFVRSPSLKFRPFTIQLFVEVPDNVFPL